MSTVVASTPTRALANTLPVRIAPRNRSGWEAMPRTARAFGLCRARRRCRFTDMNAVSDPEKNAESTKTAANAATSAQINRAPGSRGSVKRLWGNSREQIASRPTCRFSRRGRTAKEAYREVSDRGATQSGAAPGSPGGGPPGIRAAAA